MDQLGSHRTRGPIEAAKPMQIKAIRRNRKFGFGVGQRKTFSTDNLIGVENTCKNFQESLFPFDNLMKAINLQTTKNSTKDKYLILHDISRDITVPVASPYYT